MTRPRPTRGVEQQVYLGGIADELAREAQRLDRSVAWLIRRAWVVARGRMR